MPLPKPTERALLWGMFAAALLLRVVVAYHWLGSTDVKRWLFFSALIEKGAYRDLYFTEAPLWNHPAPVILLLKFISWLHRGFSFPFHFALKLPAVAADLGVLALLYRLGSQRLRPRTALLLGYSYAFSPATIIVSGYHGNTDCIMILFVLLAVNYFPSRRSLSALCLGAALSTKYVPLLLFPVFVLRCRSARDMIRFAGLSLAPLVLLSVPFIYEFPAKAFANIAGYDSFPGAWGLGHLQSAIEMGLLGSLGKPFLLSAVGWALAGSKIAIVAAVLVLALLGRFHSLPPLLDAVAIAMALFFAFTPGFSVQYTVWLVPLILLASPTLGTVFNIAMSHFLTNAYLEGLTNDMGMVNPEVRVTAFSLLAWLSVLGFLAQRAIRGLERSA